MIRRGTVLWFSPVAAHGSIRCGESTGALAGEERWALSAGFEPPDRAEGPAPRWLERLGSGKYLVGARRTPSMSPRTARHRRMELAMSLLA